MKTLLDYHTEWERDAVIDPSDLDGAARAIPLLHAKWLKYWSTEKLSYHKADAAYKTLYRQKFEYYLGKMDDVERQRLGWPPQPLRILSANLSVYMDADPDIQTQRQTLEYRAQLLRAIEDVIKNINARNYIVKSAIDFVKWKSGV